MHNSEVGAFACLLFLKEMGWEYLDSSSFMLEGIFYLFLVLKKEVHMLTVSEHKFRA